MALEKPLFDSHCGPNWLRQESPVNGKASEWRFDGKEEISKVWKYFPPNDLLMTVGNFLVGISGRRHHQKWDKPTPYASWDDFVPGENAYLDSNQEETARKPKWRVIYKITGLYS